MEESLETLLSTASQAVKTAGEYLLQNRFTALQKFLKGEDGDFATQLDIATEKVIKDILITKFPDIPVMGEETGLSGNSDQSDPFELKWYVDPLDGTKAFFQGNIAFTSVSIALADGELIYVGAVYNPFTHTLYTATRDTPTLVNGHPVDPKSFPRRLADSRIILDFSKTLNVPLRRALVELELDNVFSRIFRYEGSVAQHLCLIGSGVHQGGIFWGGVKKGNFWDIGAGVLVCERAGLAITDFKGLPIRPRSETFSQIIVGSKTSQKEFLDLVEKLAPLFNPAEEQQPNPIDLQKPAMAQSSTRKRKKRRTRRK